MNNEIGAIYARMAAAVPFFESLDAYPATIPAEVMADPDWMAARVADTAKRWGSDESRVNGTLWWYSASSTLTGIPLGTGLVTGFAADPSLSGARIFLRDDGYLGGFVAASLIPITVGVDELARAMHEALTPVIEVLAEVSGVRAKALWAITTDSIANRALDAAGVRRERGSACAAGLIDALRSAGAPIPRPRFVDVNAGANAARVENPLTSVPAGRRRFTQRASCCLIYEVPGEAKCTSCPKRAPEDRVGLLAALV
ncbi:MULTISPECIES: (2Fe-2S)-binding protein [unclassified Rhodococcus (in: high G+C Gram-positive bacteria)]|uniref:(2Fe-2S)-binding protein n=1 Tax=unclassified Rhodococcus (in: high G+C Gram-positive bacteria) TaxID=192944 RepID=UPI00211C5339|nr:MULTISPECIES: (2Fe-2S)-binding protein [unclassified Rhodococcus (in: high G+C Gram-positive bacteria)]